MRCFRPMNFKPNQLYKFRDGRIMKILTIEDGWLKYYYRIPFTAWLYRSSRINNMNLMHKFNEAELMALNYKEESRNFLKS